MPSKVLSADTLFIDWTSIAPGWAGFDLDTPYQYSGSGNIIVEFRYLGHSGTTVNARAAAIIPTDRCLDAGLPTSATGSLMGFLTCLRLHYDGTSLEQNTFGYIKAIWLSE